MEMGFIVVVLLAVLLIYIFYLYQAIYSDNTCYAALFLSLCQRLGSRGRTSDRLAKYQEMRAQLELRERKQHIGGNIPLTALEQEVNKKILKEKELEYDAGFANPKSFKPSKHFFSTMKHISDTPLFKYLKAMPKGGLLHVHDMAFSSIKVLMEMTYFDHLWILITGAEADLNFLAFHFSREKPEEQETTTWILLKDLRKNIGAQQVDEALTHRFVLYPREEYIDQNEVWNYFISIFMFIEGLLCYEPVWREYFRKGLQELYDDGVQYMEIRSILPSIYDLDLTAFSSTDPARIWYEESLKFQSEHEDFIGVKLIYAPIRNVPDHIISDYIEIALQLKEKFPDFMAGFDLVNQEDNSRALKEFAGQLLSAQNDIKFYFHAGESNWFGTDTDGNMIDAVLLGTKRIGHGFGIVKHPEVLRIVKEHDIAIEVNPISNQVLLLVSDFRNHPCAHLFAHNYPVVISSDDSSIWKSSPLSHDFYIAFLGIASRSAGLGMLKQLAWNSLKYSSLDDAKKEVAFEKFVERWNAWLVQTKEMEPIQRQIVHPPIVIPRASISTAGQIPRTSAQESVEEQRRASVQGPVEQQKRASVQGPIEQQKRASVQGPVEQQKRASVQGPIEQQKRASVQGPIEQQKRASVQGPIEQQKRASVQGPIEQQKRASVQGPVEQQKRASVTEPVEQQKRASVTEAVEQQKRASVTEAAEVQEQAVEDSEEQLPPESNDTPEDQPTTEEQ